MSKEGVYNRTIMNEKYSMENKSCILMHVIFVLLVMGQTKIRRCYLEHWLYVGASSTPNGVVVESATCGNVLKEMSRKGHAF
jgi:hypothetical protein